jgi:cullin 1
VIWRDLVFIPLADRLNRAVFEALERHRQGEQIDVNLIRQVLLSYVRLGINPAKFKEPILEVYCDYFEKKFIDLTSAYYQAEAQEFLAGHSALDHGRHASRRLREEEDRMEACLHSSSKAVLMPILIKVMIENWTPQFQHEFQLALDTEHIDDLSSLYYLLNKVPEGLVPLQGIFEEHIVRNALIQLEALATEAKSRQSTVDPKTFVTTVLQLFDRFSTLCQRAFNNDVGFVSAFDRAGRRYLNVNPVTTSQAEPTPGVRRRATAAEPPSMAPRLLATYCDLILKKGPNQIKDEKEMEQTLTSIVSLFRYLPDKDVFMITYSKLLSRRLLTDTSASVDSESFIVQKLKQEQGLEMTQKLTKMIADIQISKDLNVEFQEHLDSQAIKLPLSFGVYVIAQGSWPVNTPTTPFRPPPIMEMPTETFIKFFNKKYSGRKLVYLHDVSRVEIENRACRGKVIRLNAVPYQAAILLQFNETSSLTFKQLQDATLLLPEALRSALYGLVKSKVLLANPASDDPAQWEDATSFTPNTKGLKVKGGRITVSAPWVAQRAAKTREEDVEVQQHRHHVLRSHIVRLMKSQSTKPVKHLLHNELVAAVTAATSKWFLPQPASIKKAIEGLINEEYLKRAVDSDGNWIQAYIYLA